MDKVVSDKELSRLRLQSEWNALNEGKPEWQQMADALAELEERREKEKQNECSHPG